MKPSDTAGLGSPAPRPIRAAVTITVVVDVLQVTTLEQVHAHVHEEVSSRFTVGVPIQTVSGQPYIVRAIERVAVEAR
jgi:hypothetical protein